MMEDMKNLLIQALETRGVLGQVRAKLRSSVFKIVDDQDQKFNMGCGLKWENSQLYKISDTKLGLLSAELIREFMELYKMDYSLSVFIPECSISPERIRKDEILAKLGLKLSDNLTDIPTLYFIVYFFLHSITTDPARVTSFLDTLNKKDIESETEKLVTENIKLFSNDGELDNSMGQEDMDGFVQRNLEYHEEDQAEHEKTKDNNNENTRHQELNSNDYQNYAEKANVEASNNQQQQKIDNYENKANIDSNSNNNSRNLDNNSGIQISTSNKSNRSKKSNDSNKQGGPLNYDDEFQLDNDDEMFKYAHDTDTNRQDFVDSNRQQLNKENVNTNYTNIKEEGMKQNLTNSIPDDEEISEDIIENDVSMDMKSGVSYNVSQSGIDDKTMNKKDLDKFNYIEPIGKQEDSNS